MSVLHVDSVTKAYGSKKILQDIYLKCETGKIVALLGKANVGKSTLLEIIFGTTKADSQFIKIDDQILKKQSDRKNRIAYLPQESIFPKNIKIKDLIFLFCDLENAEKLSSIDIMKSFLNSYTRNLSGGEIKIVELLTIVYSKAEFILLEKPFTGLSPIFAEKAMKIIKEMSKEKGFIISDFVSENTINLSDEIYFLSNHCLKKIKDSEELQYYYHKKNN